MKGFGRHFAPSQPIRYTFLDESFKNMYADVARMTGLFTGFAVLAIMIACLGLFALSAFMAEQRNKEIGIRKVLGASAGSIITMLSRDFVRLVLIAIVIATPIAWWAMHKWQQDFVYRAPLGWSVFVIAGLMAVLIALFTISFQSVKAALTNPAKIVKIGITGRMAGLVGMIRSSPRIIRSCIHELHHVDIPHGEGGLAIGEIIIPFPDKAFVETHPSRT